MLPVHTNGPLTVLPSFIQKLEDWAVEGRVGPAVHGACLILQMAFIVQAATGTSVNELFSRFEAQHISLQGITLERIAEEYQAVCGRAIGAVRVRSIEAAVKRLKKGATIVGIIASCDFDPHLDGVVPDSDIIDALDPVEQPFRHSLLMVGVDEQAECVILRETRPMYTPFDGLMKINMSALKKNRKAMVYIEVVVH